MSSADGERATLHKRGELLYLLSEIGFELRRAESTAGLMRAVFDPLVSNLHLALCLFYVAEEQQPTLRLESSDGLPPDAAHAIRSIQFGQGICGQVALERRPIVSVDLNQSQEPTLEPFRALGIQALASYPLLGRSGLLGVLTFGVRHPRFDQEELAFLQVVSLHTSLAVDYLRINAMLERSRADLQEKLLELEQFEELVVGRELKMIALEKELERLKRGHGPHAE